MFKKKKLKENNTQVILNYYEDNTLCIPKNMEKIIINSLKKNKIKELQLLEYSINNLSTQLSIIKKLLEDKQNSLENSRKELIYKIKKEVNPDLLCSICFDNRINIILTPCGHTFCDKCFNENRECFTCRTIVQKKYTIYI